MFGWFRKRPEVAAAERLLDTVARIARQPAFYGEGRVPDTLNGRAELLFLHGALALRRIKAEPGAQSLAQAFTDRFFASLDAGLREEGVGDMSVPRKMYKFAGAFYGRLAVYDRALTARDEADLADAIGRNVLGDGAAPYADVLAAHTSSTAEALAAASVADLDRLDVWGAAPA